MNKLNIFSFLCGVFLATSAFSAQWQVTDIQLLHGQSYKSADGSESSQTVMTFEHLSGWDYGSNYFFIDITSPDTEGDADFYGEFSPGFSFGKMGFYQEGDSPLKDVLLQLNFEIPQGPVKRSFLAGLTFEWKNLGFDYFGTQFLYRDSLGADGHTGQLTLVWLKRLGTENWPFEFSGFLDWAGQEGTVADNVHTQPSFLLDFSRKPGSKVPLKIGMEYKYWQNKYGIRGLLESLPQAKLIWIF